MEEKINQIHEILKELYPDSVSVHVLVNCEGIEVSPTYKTDLKDFSMQTITGNWVKRAEKA